MRLTPIAPLLLLLLSGACGDDAGGERPTCEEIGELCHDSSTDLGQECHEFGEDTANDEDACLAREEECRSECGGG